MKAVLFNFNTLSMSISLFYKDYIPELQIKIF